MRLLSKRSFPAVWRPAVQPAQREPLVFDKGFVREFGLVGAWVMNGAAPRDLSGNRRHVAPVGTTFGPVAGPRGAYVNFAGDNNNHRMDLGAITQNDPLSLAGLGSASFAWRARVPSGGLNNAFCRVFDKSDGGSAANGYALWFVPSLDLYEFSVASSNGPRPVTAATRDAWESWGLRIVNGQFSASNYFLDGADADATFSNTSTTFPTTTTNAAIGNWNHSTDRAWNGGLEYFYAFSRELPDGEFARLAREPYRYLVPEAAAATIFLPRAAPPGVEAGAGSASGAATVSGAGETDGGQQAAGSAAGTATVAGDGAATAAGAGSVAAAATVTGAPGGVLPEITALGAYVVNFDSDQVYYTLQPTTTRKQFSCVKALTALVLLQEYPTLGDLATTTTIEAGDAEGGTGNNLNTGDVISLYELLENLWVPSSNVSAWAIARVVGQKFLDEESGGAGDPYDRFLTEMATVATALGMTNTTFDSPSGNASADQVSSTADLAILYEAAMDNAIIATIAGLDAADIDIVRSGSPLTIEVTSGIAAMYDYAGGGTVIGAKGGINGGGDQCNLVTVWQAPNLERVGVVLMHCPTAADRITDTTAILDQLQSEFPELGATAAGAGAASGQATVAGGGAADVVGAGLSTAEAVAAAGGAAFAAAAGASAGSATVDGITQAIAAAAGAISGLATVTGVGQQDGIAAGAGESVGGATVAGITSAVHAGIGAVMAQAQANGAGEATAAAIGAASAQAVANAVASAVAAGVGAIGGTALAQAAASSIAAAAGSAAAQATVSGAGGQEGLEAGAGDIDAAAIVQAVGAAIAAGAGLSAGQATASGAGQQDEPDVESGAGSAAGQAAVSSIASMIAAALGLATASADPAGIGAAVAAAAGAVLAQASASGAGAAPGQVTSGSATHTLRTRGSAIHTFRPSGGG